MKKLYALLLYCLAIPFLSSAQRFDDELHVPSGDIKTNLDTVNNFFIQDDNIIWQKIYQTYKTAPQIIEYFTTCGVFDVSYTKENTLGGSKNIHLIDYKKYGYRRMTTGDYITKPVSYMVRIDVKDNQYRVSVYNIAFHSYKDLKRAWFSENKNQINTLYEYAYNPRKKQFNNLFVSLASEPFSTHLTDLFTIHESKQIHLDTG